MYSSAPVVKGRRNGKSCRFDYLHRGILDMKMLMLR